MLGQNHSQQVISPQIQQVGFKMEEIKNLETLIILQNNRIRMMKIMIRKMMLYLMKAAIPITCDIDIIFFQM